MSILRWHIRNMICWYSKTFFKAAHNIYLELVGEIIEVAEGIDMSLAESEEKAVYVKPEGLFMIER